jgi:hypothetical protein
MPPSLDTSGSVVIPEPKHSSWWLVAVGLALVLACEVALKVQGAMT